jgi:hypothetical protein
MESGMLRESAKKLPVTGSEAAVLEQKEPWALELRDVIVRIVKTANPRRIILLGSCARLRAFFYRVPKLQLPGIPG